MDHWRQLLTPVGDGCDQRSDIAAEANQQRLDTLTIVLGFLGLADYIFTIYVAYVGDGEGAPNTSRPRIVPKFFARGLQVLRARAHQSHPDGCASVPGHACINHTAKLLFGLHLLAFTRGASMLLPSV